jgi:hypothetical protein
MKKRSFTESRRIVGACSKVSKYWKKVKSKKRRQVSNDEIKAFEAKFTSAWNIS